ncbi:MAG: hypothetical protein M0P13_00135 [Fibrobacteraceae bacterium]|nr:hypothetical protein [Fibrobacteraceae bacterium]
MNPFILSGYFSAEYFCDREAETRTILAAVQNRNHRLIISPRRMGKSGLIRHCFAQPEIQKKNYCFFMDIYSTLCLADFVTLLGNQICTALKPRGKKALEVFAGFVRSLEFRVSVDATGVPEWSLGGGAVTQPQKTLEEIFTYLAGAGKFCVVAIDEFQQIGKYPEKNTEALLRTHIQNCPNAVFLFAGSGRHVLENMFGSPSRPFYNMCTPMTLKAIPLSAYTDFALHHFAAAKKKITAEGVRYVYNLFEGHTWYMQSVLNLAFYMTEKVCSEEVLRTAVADRIAECSDMFESLLYVIPQAQQAVLKAIAAEGRVEKVLSGSFIQKYRLRSASAVQSALKRLMDDDRITLEDGGYRVNDRFFAMWLKRVSS